jgi:hypothetical protein
VYKGKDNNSSSTLVAVKVLPTKIIKDDEILREGLREEI